MKCFKPRYVPNPQHAGDLMLVPCGKCLDCLNRRRNDWVHRLKEEDKDSEISYFLTLTYNNENLPLQETDWGFMPVLYPYDLEKYWKRVRKAEKGKTIKYYAVGEYGEETDRPHYHAIVFNASAETLEKSWNRDKEPMGFVTCDNVEVASIRYVTKYMINQNDEKHNGRQKPFARMSKNIGMGYIKRTKAFHRAKKELIVTNPGGIIQSMPRYYRERIFSPLELKLIREETLDQLPEDELAYEEEMARQRYVNIVTRNKSKSKNC